MAENTVDEQNLINRIVSRAEAQNARAQLEVDFRTYWDMYNGKLPNFEVYPWRSKVFIKEAFKAVDAIHPIFLDMLFQSGDPFRIKGTKGDLTDQQARVIERLIKVYIEKMDCYNTIDDIVKDALIYGTAFAKVYWKREVINFQADEITYQDKLYNIAGLKLKRKEKVVRKVNKSRIKEGPCIERVDWKDIFVGTRCDDIQKHALIHRTWQTLEQLHRVNDEYKAATGEELYTNLDQLDKYRNNNNVQANNATGSSRMGDREDQITQYENRRLGMMDSTPQQQQLEVNSQGEIEILEYWSADGAKIITVAGGLCIIRSVSNPYEHKQKPFLCVNYIRRPGKIWGIGCMELSNDGQSLLNTSVNQMVDNNTLTNNLMLIADRESNIDFDQMKARPGGIVYVDKEPNERLLDKVQQIRFAKVDASDVIGLAIREIQEVTGAGRIMQGTYESGAVRNTSQTRLLMGASSKRFIGKVITFEEMFLKPLVRQLYGLIQQFVDEDMVVNMIGDQDDIKYVKVTALDIARDLDFYPVGSRQLIEMEQTIHQMNNFLALVNSDPDARLLVNKRYLYSKVWDAISPDHDGYKVILSDKDAKRAFAEQQALAQMEQQQQAAQRPASLGGMNPSQPNMAGGVQ